MTRILKIVLSAVAVLAIASLLPTAVSADEREASVQAGDSPTDKGSKAKGVANAKEKIASANINLRLVNAKRGKAEIMSVVKVRGNLWPWVPKQRVEVQFFNNGKRVKLAKLRVRKGKGNYGVFEAAVQADKSGKWAASAHHEASNLQRAAHTKRQSWRLTYPSLREGQCGAEVVGFKKALAKMGYITNGGRCIAGRTLRGVHAYRKVNGMDRTFAMPASLVEKVYRGKGGYKVRYPNAEGVHMEAPLDKQVLVFAKGSKPVAIYPVSSGSSATPTVRGSFRMQWTEPGYNSLGMYYSWYFYRGYAIHGYQSVPTYPASHGCLRTFIADQPEIFNRINAGDQIFIW